MQKDYRIPVDLAKRLWRMLKSRHKKRQKKRPKQAADSKEDPDEKFAKAS